MQWIKRTTSALLLLPLLLLSGCYYYVDGGCASCGATLIVHNDDNAYGSIWYVYAAPSSAPSWGEDLLGRDVLYPGDEMIIDVEACDRYYDVRVEYEDGLAIEKHALWLPCASTTAVTFSD